ncbi:DUF3105 domain-containing protein [Acrocarpospora macrocephala]|uniref:Membrane protein n=1 Tax=Acrocarpospora macrocephala TaxID=150177 RepID=A0A5M3WL07_9ACTN|nr:DUF3105 domain-containing protein [Acrocarpospora macrocephala]GES08722.1 membrane protein [Acrocarpospora macrocephala]
MSDKSPLTRKERLAQLQTKQRRREGARTIIVVSAAFVTLVAVVTTVAVLIIRERSKSSLDAVRVATFDKRDHTTDPVTYQHSPPIGGDHDPKWQNCGVYAQSLRKENVVHAQEHGAVWITVRPDLPITEVEKVVNVLNGRDYVILSPYDGQQAPVIASAWGKQLTLDGADDPRLPAFLRAYIQAPDAPEPGAPCTGGTGEPLT